MPYRLPPIISAPLTSELSAVIPEDWLDDTLDAIIGKTTPGWEEISRHWLDPDAGVRGRRYLLPEDITAADLARSQYQQVKAAVRALVPKEVLRLPEIRVVIGAACAARPDLFEFLTDVCNLMSRIKAVAPPTTTVTPATTSSASTSRSESASTDPFTSHGGIPGRGFMTGRQFQESTSASPSKRSSRPEPSGGPVARLTGQTDTSSRQRTMLDTPVHAVPTNAQLTAWMKDNLGKISLTCLKCGGGHLFPNCVAIHIHGTDEKTRVFGGPAYATLRFKRDNSDENISLEAFCFNFALRGVCTREMCSYTHLCTLCGGNDHSPKTCLTYRKNDLIRTYQLNQVSGSPSRPATTEAAALAASTGASASDVDQAELPEDEQQFMFVRVRQKYPASKHKGLVPLSGVEGDPPRWATPRPEDGWPDFTLLTLDDILVDHPVRDPGAAPDWSCYSHLPLVKIRTGRQIRVTWENLSPCLPGHSEGLRRLLVQCQKSVSKPRYLAGRVNDIARARNLETGLRSDVDEAIDDPSTDYTRSHFETAKIPDRYQTLDGATSTASVWGMLHYPSAHKSPFVLASEAFSTNLVRKHGIRSPEDGGDQRLAFLNILPIKGEVQKHPGLRCTKLPTERISKPWPSSAITRCVEDRTNLIMTEVEKSRSIFVLIFGTNESDRVVKALKERLGAKGYTVEPFVWRAPQLADWECGVDCPELSVLRDECIGRTEPFPANYQAEPLFATHTAFAGDERTRSSFSPASIAAACAQGQGIPIPFTYFVHEDGGSLLIAESPHPQVANEQFTPRITALALDFAVDMLKRLAEGTFFEPTSAPIYPALEHLEWSAAKRFGDKDIKVLNLWKSVQQARSVSRPLAYAAIPYTLQVYADTIDVMPHVPGETVAVDVNDYLARAATAVASFNGKTSVEIHGPPHTRPGAKPQDRQTEAALRSTAVARDIAREVATDKSASIRAATPGEVYDCICLCLVKGKCSVRMKADGSAFIDPQRLISKTGLHPPNSKSLQRSKCKGYIPLDDRLRATALVKKTRKGFRKQTAKEKILFDRAVADYNAGMRPTLLTPVELDNWQRAGGKHPSGPTFDDDSGTNSEADGSAAVTS